MIDRYSRPELVRLPRQPARETVRRAGLARRGRLQHRDRILGRAPGDDHGR